MFKGTFRRWTPGVAADPGFKQLSAPKSMDDMLLEYDLMRHDTPLYAIVQHLIRRGWKASTAERPLVTLMSPAAGIYSTPMLRRRCKIYFQVLTALPALWGKGLRHLCHSQTVGFYRAILASEHPAEVQEKQEQAYYDALAGDIPAEMVLEDDMSDDIVRSGDEEGGPLGQLGPAISLVRLLQVRMQSCLMAWLPQVTNMRSLQWPSENPAHRPARVQVHQMQTLWLILGRLRCLLQFLVIFVNYGSGLTSSSTTSTSTTANLLGVIVATSSIVWSMDGIARREGM